MITKTLHLCSKCARESGASIVPSVIGIKRKCDVCGKRGLCMVCVIPWRNDKAAPGGDDSGRRQG